MTHAMQDEAVEDPVPKVMSKRIFGFSIFIVGIVILAFALVIGLQFPKHVYTQHLKDVCVNGTSHKYFEQWANDTYREKVNRIYYWKLLNEEDVLYKGSIPQVEQIGPYVYKETEEKVNIIFDSKLVLYKTWTQQTFDESLTAEECPTCHEDDLIRTVNAEYLRVMEEVGGPLTYSLQNTPVVLNSTLEQLTHIYGDDTLAVLGMLEENSLDQHAQLLQFPDHFNHLGFGNWIFNNEADYKESILNERDWSDFTDVEIRGIYTALTNKRILGCDMLTNYTHWDECKTKVKVPDIDAFDLYVSRSDQPTYPCTMLECLRLGNEHVHILDSVQLSIVTSCVAFHVCQNETYSCLKFPEDLTVRDSYLRAIYNYLFNHLTTFVFHRSVIVADGGLFVTRPQDLLAKGYLSANMTGRDEEVFMPGVLQHFSEKHFANRYTKRYTLSNCYDKTDGRTNLMWREYGGAEYAPKDMFPNATTAQRHIVSQFLNLPPIKQLKACAQYTLAKRHYDFFFPEFWRKMRYSEDGTVSIQGVGVRKLSLNKTTLDVGTPYVKERGLQNMSYSSGYPLWLSLPHFLYSDIAHLYNMKPSIQQHSSYIAIEPVTGVAWGRVFRYQHNVQLRNEHVPALSSDARPPDVAKHKVPLFWVEKTFTFNKDGKDYFSDRVRRLLRASCGGLVGLCVASCLVVILGVLSATVTIRGGRIMPIDGDTL